MTFWSPKNQTKAVALLGICVLLPLTFGCGKRGSTAAPIYTDRESVTGGFNDNGQAYTTFSDPKDLKEVRLQLPKLETPPNLEFSGLIKWIKVQTAKSGTEVTASVIVQSGKGPRSVVQFQGPIQTENDQYTADLKPIRNSDIYTKELVDLVSMRLVSNEVAFNKTQVFFLDSKKQPLAAALVKSETKSAYLKDPKVDGNSAKQARSQKPATTPRKATQVDIESTQVVDGASVFSLKESANSPQKMLGQMTLNGDVIETDGQCNPLRTNSPESKACLVGNSEDGGIVIKITRPDTSNLVAKVPPKSMLSSTPKVAPPIAFAMPSNTAAEVPIQTLWLELPGEVPHQSAVGQCNLQVTSNHPLIQEIAEACQNSWWMTTSDFTVDRRWNCGRKEKCIDPSVEHFFSYNKFAEYEEFVKRFEVAAPGKVPGKNTTGVTLTGKDAVFSQMLQVLDKEGMHRMLGLITYIESHFNPHDSSSSGAKGYWQFMPQTAITFGLSLGDPSDPSKPDQRTQIVPSTRAASRYLKYLLNMDKWKGNYKLSLAGYNWGEGNVRKKLIKHASETGTTISNPAAPADQDDLAAVVDYTPDFWALLDKKMLPRETRMYVLKFLYGAMVALSPQHYGLSAAPVQQ